MKLRVCLLLLLGMTFLSLRSAGQVSMLSTEGAARAKSERHGNPPSRFMRIVDGGDSVRSALELAIVRYGMTDCAADCAEVDLIAVTHIASPSFYQEINQILPSYDVVLYEFVAPDSASNPASVSHVDIGALYQVYMMLGELLGFQFQLDGVDYSGANMLHADMCRSEFFAVLEESGEEMPDFGMLMRNINASLPPAFRDPDNIDLAARCRFRRKAAVKLLKPDREDGMFGDVYIIPRNDKVARVLREQIDAGRKRIAILYGAGHMPDLQERLLSDFGMSPLKRHWLVAWDLCKIVTR